MHQIREIDLFISLHHWESTKMPNGFAETNPDIYNELRELAVRFGLFSPHSERNIP